MNDNAEIKLTEMSSTASTGHVPMTNVYTQLSAMQKEHARSQLLSTALFAAHERSTIDAIVDRLSLFTLADGEALFHQHDPAEFVFLLSTGQIKLALRARSGHEKVISLISSGNTFAEAVLFSAKRTYPVTASSIGSSTVWAIDGEHYLRVLRASNDACFAVIRCLTERLHQQVSEIERLSLHTANARLIGHLLSQVDPVQEAIGGPVVIRLNAPKNVIASRLSIVPETFSRSLSKLAREGMIQVHDDEIALLDLSRMRSYAADLLI